MILAGRDCDARWEAEKSRTVRDQIDCQSDGVARVKPRDRHDSRSRRTHQYRRRRHVDGRLRQRGDVHCRTAAGVAGQAPRQRCRSDTHARDTDRCCGLSLSDVGRGWNREDIRVVACQGDINTVRRSHCLIHGHRNGRHSIDAVCHGIRRKKNRRGNDVEDHNVRIEVCGRIQRIRNLHFHVDLADGTDVRVQDRCQNVLCICKVRTVGTVVENDSSTARKELPEQIQRKVTRVDHSLTGN